MFHWASQYTRARGLQTFGTSDALLATTTANLQRLRAELVMHHEQVELAILDLDRLAERAAHARALLQVPLPPAPTLAPVVLTAERRQREAS
jgi:hypothetical protein